MLSIEISIMSGVKQLERAYKTFLKTLNSKMQEASQSCAQAILTVVCSSTEESVITSTGVAKTTLPDERLDYSSTFQYIRCGLDHFYKEKNPIFNNSTAPDLWLSKTTSSSEKNQKNQNASACTVFSKQTHTKGRNTSLPKETITPTGVAKTVIPNERPGFNETFLHIRRELDELYKEQNPVFTNIVTPELWVNKSSDTDYTNNLNPTLPIEQVLQNNYTAFNTPFGNTRSNSLNISKTTLPDERLDFNSTFQHIHNEILGIYQKQNQPAKNTFKNTETASNKVGAIA